MNKEISHYIHKHTTFVTLVVVSVFLLLAGGEYFLYRKIMWVNKMVAEGLIQIKEVNKKAKPQVIKKGGQMMLRRNSELKIMEMNMMMPSGTQVMMDGTVIRPDGTRMKMAEGQMMEVE